MPYPLQPDPKLRTLLQGATGQLPGTLSPELMRQMEQEQLLLQMQAARRAHPQTLNEYGGSPSGLKPVSRTGETYSEAEARLFKGPHYGSPTTPPGRQSPYGQGSY